MEVHAFVDGRVGDLPPFLEEVAPLAQLVHFDAHLRTKSGGDVGPREAQKKVQLFAFSKRQSLPAHTLRQWGCSHSR